MKSILLVTLLVFTSQITFASKDGNEKAVKACLKSWGKHPFKGANPEFRTLSSKVKVLGIGGDINDNKTTSKPELVLIKTNISVLSSTKMHLMNPNGWYCLKGKVDVLGKTTVELDCKANLASSSGGANVLGAKDTEGGITILGSARIKRIGCNANDNEED